MSDPETADPPLPPELPVLPLRAAVVFPMTAQPLVVNRPVSVESVNRALAAERMVLVVMQTGEAEDPDTSELRTTGTVAVIRQMAKGPTGLNVLVEGLARARVDEYQREGNVLRARIAPQPESAERSMEVDAYVRRIQEQIEKAVALTTGLSPDLRAVLLGIKDPLRLCYVLGSLLDMKPEDKQALLEADQLIAKLSSITAALQREISLLELKGRIERRRSRR